MHGVKLAGIELDRKVMADLAMNEAGAFVLPFWSLTSLPTNGRSNGITT